VLRKDTAVISNVANVFSYYTAITGVSHIPVDTATTQLFLSTDHPFVPLA
jgi:hypothetical protein